MCHTAKTNGMRTVESIHWEGEMLRVSLTHTPKINTQKQPGASSAYYTAHYTDKWDPGLLLIICPHVRCIVALHHPEAETVRLGHCSTQQRAHSAAQTEQKQVQYQVGNVTTASSTRPKTGCDLAGDRRYKASLSLCLLLFTVAGDAGTKRQTFWQSCDCGFDCHIKWAF